jgi:hypothetical protein
MESKRRDAVQESEAVNLTRLTQWERVSRAERLVRHEIAAARQKHRPFASWHEAYAVIREELEEFWDGVKRDKPDITELAQIAACAMLAIVELEGTDTDGGVR